MPIHFLYTSWRLQVQRRGRNDTSLVFFVISLLFCETSLVFFLAPLVFSETPLVFSLSSLLFCDALLLFSNTSLMCRADPLVFFAEKQRR
jgi:hypothetical protein